MHQGPWTPFHRLLPLDFVVALYNVTTCDEVDCDPDYTYKELVSSLVDFKGKFTKEALERVLFCLNMNDEDGVFWHPLDKTFDTYLKTAVPKGYKFDKYYNVIEKETK